MATGESSCVSCWHWTASFLMWGSIIFCVAILASHNEDMYYAAYVILGGCSVTYLVSAFCASSCCYLLHPSTGADIYSYMQQLFYTPVHKVMHVQCYHYETRHHTERDAQGNTHTRTETVRVDTHSASERFYYVSWRDISGQFILDTSGAMVNQKRAFVKLHCFLDMIFSNDGTAQDFERQRESFKARNRWDTHQDYSEHLEMDGYNEFNLVKVGEFTPSMFGLGWYILFTFLLVVQFYKMYIDKFCIVQEFTLKKVVSSRRDLNSTAVVVEYTPLIPCIVYLGQTRTYNEAFKMPLMTPPPAPDSVQVQMNMGGGGVQMNIDPNMQMMAPGMNMQMNVGVNQPLLH